MILPIVLCALYFSIKMFESTYILKTSETKPPLKNLVVDTILIYICFIIGSYLMLYIKPLLHQDNVTPVFTGEPTF